MDKKVFFLHLLIKFLAFSLDEAFEFLGELDSTNIISIHIYPNYNS